MSRLCTDIHLYLWVVLDDCIICGNVGINLKGNHGSGRVAPYAMHDLISPICHCPRLSCRAAASFFGHAAQLWRWGLLRFFGTPRVFRHRPGSGVLVLRGKQLSDNGFKASWGIQRSGSVSVPLMGLLYWRERSSRGGLSEALTVRGSHGFNGFQLWTGSLHIIWYLGWQ